MIFEKPSHPLHQRNRTLPPKKNSQPMLQVIQTAPRKMVNPKQQKFKKGITESTEKTSQHLLQLGAKVSTGLSLGITSKGKNKHHFERKPPPTSDDWCSMVVLLDDIVILFLLVSISQLHPKKNTHGLPHQYPMHIRSQRSSHLTLMGLIVHCGKLSSFCMLTHKGPSNWVPGS